MGFLIAWAMNYSCASPGKFAQLDTHLAFSREVNRQSQSEQTIYKLEFSFFFCFFFFLVLTLYIIVPSKMHSNMTKQFFT